MKFGVSASGVDPHRIAEFAVAAENLGFESVWMPEHIVMPTVVKSTIPHASANLDMSSAAFLPMLDPFITLAHIATATSSVRLGSCVALLALRDPFLAARSVASLDLLSGGRASVGVGAGWCTEEYELMGIDPSSRGRRLDETLEIITLLFTEHTTEYQGKVFTFGPVAFEPKPIQKPRPPLLVGGNSAAALRRAARLGDGWIGVAMGPDQARDAVQDLSRQREGYGRDDAFEVSMRVEMELLPSVVEAFERSGVERLILRGLRMELRAGTDEAFDHIAQVAEQVGLG